MLFKKKIKSLPAKEQEVSGKSLGEKTKNLKNQTQNRKKEKILSYKKIPTQKEIEQSLKSIYQDTNGQTPNLAKLEFKTKNKTKNLVILIIIFLTIILGVSFLGFLIFQPKPKFTGEKINLEIKAPFTAISGENITYQIKIVNQEETSLTKTQLIIYFPPGFIIKTANLPYHNKENEIKSLASNIKTWQINDLFPNQNQTIEVNGYLIGDLNSRQTISATLSYIPANFSSEFQKNVSFSTEINDSLANLEIEHPSQAANHEETEIIIKVSNKSENLELHNMAIDLNYPLEYNLSESQIIDENNQTEQIVKVNREETSPKTWLIDLLPPKTQKQIKIKGKFEITESKELEFTTQIKLKGQTEDYFLQGEKKFNIEAIKGELLTNLIISGSNQNKPVNFSDTLNYLLILQNKSKKALGDLKVRIILDSALLDWDTLNDKYNGLKEESQILWTKDQISKLAFLLPEEEVEIDFQINIKEYQKKYKHEDCQIKSYFETQINKIDNNPTEIITQSNTIINEINTNLNLQAEVRYFDNNKTVGFGPLPPIVGQKTSYKVYLTLTNSLHEIQNIEVKVKLPDYVNFEAKENISTGNLYKNEHNEIIWQTSRIPNTINSATAEFDISITPKPNDVQKILTLISEINLLATDAQTKGQISKFLQGFTTNLENDPLGKGKGLVQQE